MQPGVPKPTGKQADLWAEYIETDSHYEYMLYPRVMALAEVAWSGPSRKSYADFPPRTPPYIRIQAHSDKNMGGWIFTDEIVIN